MADTPTTTGKYRKQGLGDRSAAWGLSSGLNGVLDVLDEAIHGFNGVSLATVNYTLTSTNYTSNEVRQRFHRFSNGGISAQPTITVPAVDNWWIINNSITGYALVITNGSNSVTMTDGETAIVATDGTSVYRYPFITSLVAPDPGSNGIVVRTASGTTVARTLTGPAAGITVTDGSGVSANPTLSLANDLAALEGLASTGIAVRTASDTWAQRTITGTSAEITVTNGDGVSGNPTLSLPTALTFTGKTVTGGTFSGAALSGTLTASGATWTDLGTVTTADINGGTIDGVTIGGASAGAGTFTTVVANTAVGVGRAAASDPGGTGIYLASSGYSEFVRNAGHLMYLNRLTDDGVLVYFAQGSTIEGYIGTNGSELQLFSTNTGSLVFGVNGGSEAARITSSGNVGINETSPDYKLDVNGTFGFTPGTSVTPVDNGDMTFYAPDNTTFTVAYKGSDGTVRTGTITLS